MSEKVEEIKQEEPEKKQGSKKTIAIAIAVVVLVFIILGAQTVFALLTLVAAAILIYKAVKKKPLKNAAIVCVVCLLLTGICGQFSSSDYVEILSMTKEEVDRKYGEPTKHSSGLGQVYPEGFYVVYVSGDNGGDAGMISLYNASGELLGLKLGESSSEIEKKMENYGYKYSGIKQNNGEIIHYYEKGESYARVFVSGSIISEVEVWE